VPSTNPNAPFGYDENDRPIGVPVGKPYVKPVQTGSVERGERGPLCKCNQPLCRYCHPESIARTDVLAALYDRVEVTSEVTEESLRRQWGLPAFNPTIKTDTSAFVHYPKLLGLTREKLAELLDVQVSVEVVTETNSVQKVLKPTTAVSAQIEAIKSKRASAEIRITELKQLIAESEKLIESWSAHMIKIQIKRGERQPDDILDKKTREQFKREEAKLVETYKQEKHELEKQLRSTRLQDLQERLANWGSNPDDYELKPVTQQREIPVLFADKFKLPAAEKFRGQLPPGYTYGVGAYRQLVYSYGETESVFSGWKQFENEIILQATGWGLIRPSKKLLAAHPSFGAYLVADKPGRGESNHDDAENALIIKTGGAQIGGGIYGSKNTKLKSFVKYDQNYRRGNDKPGIGYGGERPDNFFGGMDSGDLDERKADE
jgi:hypothetical protein